VVIGNNVASSWAWDRTNLAALPEENGGALIDCAPLTVSAETEERRLAHLVCPSCRGIQGGQEFRACGYPRANEMVRISSCLSIAVDGGGLAESSHCSFVWAYW
jgi:hypothetical protein